MMVIYLPSGILFSLTRIALVVIESKKKNDGQTLYLRKEKQHFCQVLLQSLSALVYDKG
jgi:hypothetical protein